MATKKRTRYIPKAFESLGEKYIDNRGKTRTDTSANLYESMLLSKAFSSLTPRQKILYVYCKAQYYGKRKPEKDYPDIEQFKGAELFYLNWATVKRYGLYKDSMHSNFYNDMKALCEHGLITKLSSGAQQHKKSIYRFSTDWKNGDDLFSV